MKTYRLLVYEIGHVNASIEIAAEHDAAAIQVAEVLFPDSEREIWELGRFVGRLTPDQRG